MAKVAVIGDKETILGFKAVGVDVFDFEEKKELNSFKTQVNDGEYDLIFVTENAYLELEKELKELEEKPVPAVLVIPSVSGNLGIADNYIDNIVQKAVGMKL